jgi:hypothetical protein
MFGAANSTGLARFEKLGEPIPKLAPYDSAKGKKFPWEVEMVATIEKLPAKKKAAGDTLASS